MSKLYYMITIANREKFPRFLEVYRKRKIDVNLISLGYGTQREDMIASFGLDRSERAVCMAMVTGRIWAGVKKDLLNEVYINVPNTGIACIVPVSSVGGSREFAFLKDGMDFEPEEESELKGTENELLVVISNQGYNEIVMDAARSAGAGGGTVLHARGTGMEKAERFFGISLASEKDVTFIVAAASLKSDIMRAIMEKAGMNTDAKSIVFSLPVTDAAGLALSAPADEEDGAEHA